MGQKKVSILVRCFKGGKGVRTVSEVSLERDSTPAQNIWGGSI